MMVFTLVWNYLVMTYLTATLLLASALKEIQSND